MAARALDLAGLVAGAGRKAIRYDQALDPTDPASAPGQLRVALDRPIRIHLEGH